MSAAAGLPHEIVTASSILLILTMIRLLLPTITRCGLAVLAALTSDTARADRVERVLRILHGADMQQRSTATEDREGDLNQPRDSA